MSKMIETFKMLKEKHSDALILFRVGDFYEAYCEDAQKASEVLGVTLTRNKDGECDYACFPCDSLDIYLPKLIRAGIRVAICDDISEPVMLKHRGSDETTAPQVEDADAEEIKTEEPQQEEKTPLKSVTVYKADGSKEEHILWNNYKLQMEEMQEIVGGYFEYVSLSDGRLIIVNEKGLLQGLPVNIEATNILRRDHATTQYIVGNAIICDSDMIE